ncbi:MAG: ATP-binding cassette domain-containing protein, partial [Chloroflexota bacterium]
FIKTMLGHLEPLAGEIHLGGGLKVGYFAQAQDALNDENSLLEEFLAHAAGRKALDDGEARHMLAGYLFQGEDVFKRVGALSGGERARLALAILALEGANFLVLDEPTNHLDIPAREALQEVLENYTGTILLVSHDRYLVNRLATQIWDLRAGRLDIFRGGYREFLLRRAPVIGQPAAGRQTLLTPKPMVRDNSRETRKRQEALQQLEQRIRDQELSVQRLSKELQKAGEKASFDRVHELSNQMAQAQARLEDLMGEWERLVV